MRAAIGGGKAVISSNVKVAAAGTSLDVPLGHKDDSWSFPQTPRCLLSQSRDHARDCSAAAPDSERMTAF
jgi:hypothetical protein